MQIRTDDDDDDDDNDGTQGQNQNSKLSMPSPCEGREGGWVVIVQVVVFYCRKTRTGAIYSREWLIQMHGTNRTLLTCMMI